MDYIKIGGACGTGNRNMNIVVTTTDGINQTLGELAAGKRRP